jgi:hypothetical protein
MFDCPQTHKQFDAETVCYIENLDPDKDIEHLKIQCLKLKQKSTCIYPISTMLLKKGVARGLTPEEIGMIMCDYYNF